MLPTQYAKNKRSDTAEAGTDEYAENHPVSVGNGIAIMMEMFTGLALLLLIAMTMAMVGCGKEDAQPSVKPRPVSDESIVATPPATSIEAPTPVESPVVEEPVVVSFADAETKFNERNYTEAVSLFQAYTQQNSENAWGHYMLGLSAKRAGDLPVAEAAFRRALEIDPDHSKSSLNLARVLIEDLRPQDALDELDRVVAAGADSNVAMRLQGRAFHNLGWLDDAENAYREAIVLDSSDAWSMNNLALVLLERERYEDALTALSRSIELRDDVSVFFNNLGMALEHTGRVRQAQDAYSSAVAIDEGYEKAAANLSRVESIEEDPSIEPADFEALAQVFIEQIRAWNEDALAAENANMIEVDSIRAEEIPDSTMARDFN